MKLAALIVLLAVAAASGQLIDPNGAWVDAAPSKIGGTFNATLSDALAAGYAVPTAEQVAAHESEPAAEAQAAAEAAAQEQVARIGQLATQFGPMVGALQVFLSQVGYSIPVEPATVTGDLLTRAIAGTLTAEQREAKANIADLYIYLQAAGLSNADIAAVWEAIKP